MFPPPTCDGKHSHQGQNEDHAAVHVGNEDAGADQTLWIWGDVDENL